MDRFRKFVIKLLPYRLVEWYRRRRSIRRYMKGLSVGFYAQIVKDLLERTDIILQELDRRVEGVAARTEESVVKMQTEIGELRDEIARLRDELGAARESHPTAVAE
ncbi:MAG: hypothetical protein E6G39_11680 [Actinobacteria bacterium]|nr:MAG: hypothetical protein E6G39_11680 [Actinomycetota bacterium]